MKQGDTHWRITLLHILQEVRIIYKTRNQLDVKVWMVKKPAQTVTRRAEEGEALIARVHRSNLAPADAGMVEQSIRMYFWVAFALQEAKLRVKRLRDLFFGPSRKRTGAPECAAS